MSSCDWPTGAPSLLHQGLPSPQNSARSRAANDDPFFFDSSSQAQVAVFSRAVSSPLASTIDLQDAAVVLQMVLRMGADFQVGSSANT